MARIETATCQDCGWHGPVEETKELRNVWDRVLPGAVMPAGECPEEGCAGAAMLDRGNDNDDLRPAMVALMLGLDRLRESVRTGTLPTPVADHLQELADYARKALAAGPLLQPVCNACSGTAVPGRRMGLLGHASAALGAAQHLRGRRHLRRLRRRV